MFDVLLTTLDTLLSLLVHRLQLTDAHEIIDGELVLFSLLIGEASSQVGLDEHVDILDVGAAVNHLGAVLDLIPVMLVLAIAEGNVAENGSLKLSNLLLKDSKVLIGDIKNFCGILVQFDSLSVRAFFELGLSHLFGGIHLGLNLVKLGLQLDLLLVVEG